MMLFTWIIKALADLKMILLKIPLTHIETYRKHCKRNGGEHSQVCPSILFFNIFPL